MYRFVPLPFCVLAAPLAAQVMLGQPAVFDGDTFAFGDDVIRIYGIDAPERSQTCERGGVSWNCGEAAKLRLQELLSQGRLQCQPMDRDRYQRSVSVCRVGSRDIGAVLVSEGLAIALPDFAQDYVAAESRAREQGLGVWAGSFQLPADYRADNAAAESDRPRPSLASRPPVTVRPKANATPAGVYFRNCSAARAAGVAPLRRGQPGYRTQLDADGDGVACEPLR